MKIACTTLACPDWSLETILARFKEYGYDGVDFRGLGSEMHVYRLPEFSTDSKRTAGKIASSGLAVSAFSSGARMFHAEPSEKQASLDEVGQYVRLCRAFGAPMIRVFGGALKGAPRQQAIAQAAETLARMAEMAAPDVTIAVETHDDWIRSDLLAEVMQRVEADNVGALWDLHHPFRLAGESPRQTFDNIGRYTVATHVKDSLATGPDKYEYRLGGQGDVPLAEMVRLLAGAGYDGYLTLEWEKKWHPELADPEVALPAYAKFLRRLGN